MRTSKRTLFALSLVLSLGALDAPPAAARGYEPVDTCRLYDTRDIPEDWRSILRPSDIRSIGVVGQPYGECNLPADARAVVATVTVTQTTGAGHLKIWPSAGPPGSNIPTGVVLAWDRSGTTASAGTTLKLVRASRGLWLRTYGSATHVIIDVVGYYR